MCVTLKPFVYWLILLSGLIYHSWHCISFNKTIILVFTVWEVRVLSILLFVSILYVPVNNFSVMLGWVYMYPGWTSTKQRISDCSRTQLSASSEARTSNPLILSQALYTEPLRPSVSSIQRFTSNYFYASGDFCCLLITFANSLDPDQDQQNVGPDLDPNCLTLW